MGSWVIIVVEGGGVVVEGVAAVVHPEEIIIAGLGQITIQPRAECAAIRLCREGLSIRLIEFSGKYFW